MDGTLVTMKEKIYEAAYVKGLFDRMSTSYERVNYLTSFGFSLRWRWQFLQSLDFQTDRPIKAIDLLTGMGEVWGPLRRKLPQAELHALDFSPGMLNYAAAKNRKQFAGKIHILEEDVLNNQLPANHFDLVVCSFGLKTFKPEQLKTLAQVVRRILKPGGQFSFIEISNPDNRLLSHLYGFYLGKVIPVFGFLLLGNPSEYRMLWEYTKAFDNAQVAAELFAAEQLEVNYQSYFYGCASGFTGKKKEA